MIKHIFIINPAAGKSKGLRLIPHIKSIFSECPDEYVIEVTSAPGHAEMLAASYSRQGKCRIYSVGGDGTLNEVMNGMAGTDSELAILPCGTGNDFIRSITNNLDAVDLLYKTINGRVEYIDFGKINSRYFINIASVGFDAEVVYNTDKFKHIPGISGSVAYILGILYTIFKFSGENLRISVDGQVLKKKLLLVAIANGKYYGGGMQPVPQADLKDGKLDVCMIDALNILKILVFFPRLIKGTHCAMKEVSFLKGTRIEIESASDICINADGEISRGRKAVLELQPKKFAVILPDNSISSVENYKSSITTMVE